MTVLAVRAVLSQTTTFDHYISSTGSDSNAGTLAAPWAITSLQDTNSNNSKMAGKRIGLIAGTYACSGLTSGSTPNDYQHPALALPQGTSTNPTYVASCNSSGIYTPRVAILDNSTSSTTSPLIGQNPNLAGYWTLDGLTIKGNNSTAQAFLVAGRYNAFSYTNSSSAAALGVTVQNCEIYGLNITGPSGSNFGGMMMQGTNGAVIKNVKIHDIYKPADPTHCHCYEEYGSINSKISLSSFYNSSGGMDLKAGVSGADIGECYFYNLTGTSGAVGAIVGTDGAEGNPNDPSLPAATVHNCVFDSCSGIHVCDVNNVAEQNVIYFNNTTYDTRSTSNVVADLRTSGATAQYYNNILVTTANTGGDTYGTLALTSGGWSNVSNNCYSLHTLSSGWGQTGASGTPYSTLAAFQASTGSPDANSIVASPGFVGTITPGAGAAQFALGAGSPCLGTGVGGVNMGAWDGVATQIGCNF